MTDTFLLTWNPVGGWIWPASDRAEKIAAVAAGERTADQWSTGVRGSGIRSGDRCFLLRQRIDRGIVGSGYFTSEVFDEPHWDDTPGKVAHYALLEWDALMDPEDRLPVEELKREVGGVPWDRLQGSGVRMAPSDAARLEAMWGEHLGDSMYYSPEEARGTTYTEGGVTTIEVDRYERSRPARAACLGHWGTTCVVCGLDFERRYGPIGKGFIHVHHLRELNEVGTEHEVDPVADLRPVCPNCHAMLHAAKPALTVGQLKRRLHR